MKREKDIFCSPDLALTCITTVLIAFAVLIILSGNIRTEKEPDGKQGTVSVSASLDFDAVPSNSDVYPFAGKINGSGVRLREKPSTETGKIIRELNDAARVEVVGKEGAWYLVRLKDDEGYIYADYVSRAS